MPDDATPSPLIFLTEEPEGYCDPETGLCVTPVDDQDEETDEPDPR